MTRKMTYLLVTLLAVLPVRALAVSPDEKDDIAYYSRQKTMHFTDTLDIALEIHEFEQAVKIAPTTFAADSSHFEPGVAAFKKLRLNRTIDRALETDIVKADPGLEKRIRRLRGWTRPFGAACDLVITYRYIENGYIYVEYDLSRIRLFVFG